MIYGIVVIPRNLTGYRILYKKSASAVYTPEGQAEIMEVIQYYQKNARIISEGLTNMGFKFWGGRTLRIFGLKPLAK